MTAVILHNHPIHYKHLLFKELAKLGLEFTVLFGGTQSNLRSEPVALSQELYKYQFLFNGPLETAPAIPRIAAALRALDELKPKVLISAGYERPENWAAWAWAILHKVPVILWYESNKFDWPRQWWKELPKRLFMTGLAGAHVYGRSNRDYLCNLGLRPSSILIKRAVVDVGKFTLSADQKTYRPNGITRLLYIGRLAPEKNLPFLIQAFSEARAISTMLRLTIVGSGLEEQAIKALVDNMNLSDSVSLTGYVPQAELRPYLRDADVFILPSTREPWGLVALEAMLARMPILVSTQCGCAADLVSPDTGWSFSPWDQKQLTALLAALPQIPTEKLHTMGDAAHAIAVEYSPAKLAKTVVQTVRDLPSTNNRIVVRSESQLAAHG
jgi:glycosyltransferase involved in cell wall biosynthesis